MRRKHAHRVSTSHTLRYCPQCLLPLKKEGCINFVDGGPDLGFSVKKHKMWELIDELRSNNTVIDMTHKVNMPDHKWKKMISGEGRDPEEIAAIVHHPIHPSNRKLDPIGKSLTCMFDCEHKFPTRRRGTKRKSFTKSKGNRKLQTESKWVGSVFDY